MFELFTPELSTKSNRPQLSVSNVGQVVMVRCLQSYPCSDQLLLIMIYRAGGGIVINTRCSGEECRPPTGGTGVWRDNNPPGLSPLSCHQTFFTASSKVRKTTVANDVLWRIKLYDVTITDLLQDFLELLFATKITSLSR